jgi:hypothetical protein
MWAVAAIVLLVCGNSYGEEPAMHYSNHKYVRNTTLPPDCVELAADCHLACAEVRECRCTERWATKTP